MKRVKSAHSIGADGAGKSEIWKKSSEKICIR